MQILTVLLWKFIQTCIASTTKEIHHNKLVVTLGHYQSKCDNNPLNAIPTICQNNQIWFVYNRPAVLRVPVERPLCVYPSLYDFCIYDLCTLLVMDSVFNYGDSGKNRYWPVASKSYSVTKLVVSFNHHHTECDNDPLNSIPTICQNIQRWFVYSRSTVSRVAVEHPI